MIKSTGNFSSSIIKSVVFYTNYGDDPCAYLRLRGPMDHLGIKVFDGKILGVTDPDLVSKGDIVVIQRDFPREFENYEKIIKNCRAERIPIIFDIDDLLFLLPEGHPDRQGQIYVESLLPMLQAIHEADIVTVPTPKLQQWISTFNSNIHLLPNFLDDALWKLRAPLTEEANIRPLVIGFMGSESHIPDLEFIAPALSSIIQKYPDELICQFWGAKPPEKLANLPQVKWSPAVSYDYKAFTSYFQTQKADIFIAPLENNEFNRAKSPLKFFEYTALGAPGIYSKLETFEQVVKHNFNGLFASSLEEWEKGLDLLIKDSRLREKIIHNAQKTITENWLLSANAYRWLETFERAQRINESQGSSNLSPSKIFHSLANQYHDLIEENKMAIEGYKTEISDIRSSRSWKLAMVLKKLTGSPLFRNSLSERILKKFYHWYLQMKNASNNKQRKAQLKTLLNADSWLPDCQDVPRHKQEIDVIICVHNALEDVHRCLESVVKETCQPFNIIIVDDGSENATKTYLEAFAASQANCKLIRNEKALGYTYAANIGMRASTAPLLVLLNSDTIVTENWLDRMHRAITRDQKIGVVSPLSNTASWQSIPKLSEDGDWAMNKLPTGLSIASMGQMVSKYAGCIHPAVPLLNGFCLMIRRKVIDEIGIFDEDNFGRGYGEEDDFIIRANKAGWKSVIVDNAYIYHAQSKSYTNEGRFELQKQSGVNLQKKHSKKLVAEKVSVMNPNRVMEGIRARAAIMPERERVLQKGRENFKNKRVLFLLPIKDAGGGANVILDEAKHMQAMGVKVSVFNLSEHKWAFNKNYAHVDIPFIFGKASDLPKLASSYDAVIASANYSVPWLEPLAQLDNPPILGYYIQGFEPLMYHPTSEEYQSAQDSYTSIKSIKRFTKTMWTRDTVFDHTGVDSELIGISVNIDLFRPRDVIPYGVKPVTIVAMVRQSSVYRNPDMTVKILKEVQDKYKNDVDIWFFGANDIRDIVNEDLLNFKWRQLGKLTQLQVASMMSKADIFTDFSSHQAMGLAALEAMAAGSAVLVPKNGGAVEFVTHRENGMVTDTSYYQTCLKTLEELIKDNQLRTSIQLKGMHDVVQYFPEKASYNILKVLFS